MDTLRRTLLAMAARPREVATLLGETDLESVRFTLGLVGRTSRDGRAAEACFGDASATIRRRWPRPGRERSAALRTLLMLRGVARQHAPLSFDADTVAELAA